MPKKYSQSSDSRNCDREKTGGRVEKLLRVLTVIQSKGKSPDGLSVPTMILSRPILAELAEVSPRNLDAILSSLRRQGYDIQYSDQSGYYLEDPYALSLPRVRTPVHYQELHALRRYIEQVPGAIDQKNWLELIDTILENSQVARRHQMGRTFEDAKVDDDGVMYKIAEPMIFYLNVHRADPDQLTRAHLDRLTTAISRCQRVRMQYINRQDARDTIIVEPYFIFQREGTYYMAGVQTADRNGDLKRPVFKPFVISKARCPSLDVLPGTVFERQPAYEPEQCLTVTGIRSQDPAERVTAEMDIYGKFAYNACEVVHGEASSARWVDAGGTERQLHLQATFGSRYDLVRYVLAYGENAEISAPPEIRDIMRANIIGMARRYGIKIDLE